MIGKKIVCELLADFTSPVGEVDVPAARQAFADLMDQSLPEIQTARLDQDEILLERFAMMRDESDTAPQAIPVSLPFIGESADWVAAFDKTRKQVGLPPCSPATTAIIQLKLIVLHEEDTPLFDL